MRCVVRSLLVGMSVLIGGAASAQVAVTGVVVDAASEQPLPGATVLALGPDSTRTGASAGTDGAFRLLLADGAYRLRVSFIGYLPAEQDLTVDGAPVDLGQLALRADTTELGETVVEAVETRVTVRGDTTAYNAAAYGVNPDATVGDLVQKLPGVTVQDGEVQANGETVQRVLVDGKEFFGDSPTTALENLPAEAVQEIQVYDRASDQAEFTGFDDGEEQRTINIVTKPERRTSVFGRASAGLGSDLRYAANGTVNVFAGDRRVSVFARADNVDFQTLNALQGEERESGPRIFRFRDGITRTASLGANYNDQWGERVELSGTYSLSASDNTRDVALSREYVVSEAAGQRYVESTDAEREDLYHDLFGEAEIEFSDRTELLLRSTLELATNATDDVLAAQTALPTGGLLSRTRTVALGDGFAYDAGLRTTLRHKFQTEGRTLSGTLRLGLEGDDADRDQDVERAFFLAGDGGLDSLDAFARRVGDDQAVRTTSADLTYSEPLAEGLQVLVSYTPSVSLRDADQAGFRRDEAGAYTVVDSSFTSVTDQRVVAHRVGADLQRRSETVTGTVGLSVEHERLAFEQGGPRAFDVDRTTTSLLPSARVEVEVSERSSVNVSYRSSTDTPRPTQLRDVADDSNPLLVVGGNPDLRTARDHSAYLRFRTAAPEAGTSLSANLRLRTVRDYIGTATVAAGADTLRVRDVVLPPGGQLSVPVNLDGYLNASLFLTYGRPLSLLQSNLNSFVSVGYSRTPSLLDGVLNRADALTTSAQLFLGTNASERFDLSASYGVSARFTSYTLGTARSPRYTSHRGGVDLNWLPWRGLTVRSSLDLAYTPSIGAGLDPLVSRLDLGLGYKFLPGDRAEARLTVVDVFDQRASVDRRVTDLYIEDRETLALGRFVLFNLSYTIRQSGGGGGRPGRPPGPRGIRF